MSDGSQFSLEQFGSPPWRSFGADAAFMNEVNQWRVIRDIAGGGDAVSVDVLFLTAPSKLHFTTAAADAESKVVPDYILGVDGKLRRNPDKKEPNKDGTVNVEVESANNSEVQAKKAANELQRAWARDMIQRWMASPDRRGQDVPQEWRDLADKPDETGSAPADSGSDSQASPPLPDAAVDNGGDAPSGGSGGGYGGGAPSGDGGSIPQNPGPERSGGGDTNNSDSTPRGDIPMRDVPGPVPPGQALAQFQQAIERANNGGEPLRVLQYGDSHIVAGTEPKAIEDALKQLAPVEYSTQAKVGISANYPMTDPQNWLDKPIQQANPDLVILSFGSNDAAGAVNKEAYMQTYQNLIDNIRQRAPNASILIVAPPDGDSITGANKGNTLPGLDTVVEAQREIAARNGLDFFDLRASMGGAGSVEDWHAKGLAAGDKLHFTAQGYQLIGNSVADHLKNGVHRAS